LRHPGIRLPFCVKLTFPSVPAGEEVAIIAALTRYGTVVATDKERVAVPAVTVIEIADDVDASYELSPL
jgi:hypothetical protein